MPARLRPGQGEANEREKMSMSSKDIKIATCFAVKVFGHKAGDQRFVMKGQVFWTYEAALQDAERDSILYKRKASVDYSQ